MADWLFAQSGIAVYTSLIVLLMGGAIGLPIPEDIPLIFAGVLLHRGHVELVEVFIVCYVGIIVGDILIFFIGRKLGSSVKKRNWLNERFSPELIEKTKRELEKRSFFTIVLARHLFYLRSVTFLTCGAVKMSFRRFIIADAIAALISATIMIWIGYFFSDQYEYIFGVIKRAKFVALWGGLAVMVICVTLYLRRRKDTRRS